MKKGPTLQKTDVDDIQLAPDKYILSGFMLHTGEFETERYYEEVDLKTEFGKRGDARVKPGISLTRLLLESKQPDIGEKDERKAQTDNEEKSKQG